MHQLQRVSLPDDQERPRGRRHRGGDQVGKSDRFGNVKFLVLFAEMVQLNAKLTRIKIGIKINEVNSFIFN